MGSDSVSTQRSTKPVRIGGVTFDNNFYDREVDVLYLHVGAPTDAVDYDGTAEGDGTRYGADGSLVGLTLVSPKYRLEHDGKIELTLPEHNVVVTDLGDLLD